MEQNEWNETDAGTGEESGDSGGCAHERREENAPLVDAREAAAMCRMSRAMLYKLHRNGKTPEAVRLGKLLRWRRSELLGWIALGCPDRAAWEAMRPRNEDGQSFH